MAAYYSYKPYSLNSSSRITLNMSNGNKKIGEDTLIFNITSATDCPSKSLGLCHIPDGKCYALKAEKLYPGCLSYRRKQAEYFDARNSYGIAHDIYQVLTKRIVDKYKNGQRKLMDRIKYIRFSECGDFRSQTDVDKLNEAAEALNFVLNDRDGKKPIIWYGYSSRSDLDFSNADSLLVKGSAHTNGNNGVTVSGTLEESEKGRKTIIRNGVRHLVCKGDCSTCKICKLKKSTPLFIPLH